VIGAGGLWKFGEEPREVGIWLDAARYRAFADSTSEFRRALALAPATVSEKSQLRAKVTVRSTSDNPLIRKESDEGLGRPETRRRAAQDLLLGTSKIRLSDSSRANELGLVDGGPRPRAVDGV
jgi:hypothetical protein